MATVDPDLTPAQAVRLQYLASATGDMGLWRQVVAEDVEWTESAGFPPAGTTTGQTILIHGAGRPAHRSVTQIASVFSFQSASCISVSIRLRSSLASSLAMCAPREEPP